MTKDNLKRLAMSNLENRPHVKSVLKKLTEIANKGEFEFRGIEFRHLVDARDLLEYLKYHGFEVQFREDHHATLDVSWK